jgi:hypothetical protein
MWKIGTVSSRLLTMVGQNVASGAHVGLDTGDTPHMESCIDQHRQQTTLDHVASA